MDICIIDRIRNVRVVPSKGAPFEAKKGEPVYGPVLDGLLASQADRAHTGRLEFECDAQFAGALDTEKPDGLVEEAEIETLHGGRSRSYKGVPIVVVPAPEPAEAV